MALPRPPAALVASAQAGEPRALDRIVQDALPAVLGWCARLGGPRVDPEDAAHEVMLVLVTRLPHLSDPAAFPAWLFAVTRRVLAAQRRRAWIRRWVPSVLPDPPDPAPGPEARCAGSETARRVQEALEELPAEQREVFVLCDVEERTDEEVAALVGRPVGTVKSRLRLARERFRRAAGRRHLAPDPVELAAGEARS